MLVYKVLRSALAPCEMRKRYPPTSCVLVSFLRFPCGTLAATILQVDNCIVTTRPQHFCLFYLNNPLSLSSSQCLIKYQEPFGRRGCGLVPFHLLNGVGTHASLFSPAKATQSTQPDILRFLSHPLPRVLRCHVRSNRLSSSTL